MTTPPPSGPHWGPPATAPQWGAPAGADDPYAAAPPPAAPPSVLGTVLAHLVLWPGLVLVAFTYRPIVLFLLVHLDGVSNRVLGGVMAVYVVAPVAGALVIAARQATLRWVAVLGAVGLVVTYVVLNLVPFAGYAYLVPAALCVLGLGTWVAVRRHARWGLLLLVPAAVLVYLWFGPPGFTLRSLPYRQGVTGAGWQLLWGDLPIVALGVLGLVSSLLRPRPSPDRDAVAFAVVGGLIVLTAAAGVLAALL